MKNTICKKIMAIAILVTMLFLNCSTLVFAVTQNIQKAVSTENDKVKFDIEWLVGDNKTTANIQSNTPVGVGFNIALSGVETGFRDMKLTVLSRDTKNRMTVDIKTPNTGLSVIDKAQTQKSVLVFKEIVDSGRTIGGSANITFDRAIDFKQYSKDVTFILTGSYIDPQTNVKEDIYIEKTLTANVQSKEYIDAFTSDMQITTNNVNKTTIRPAGGMYGEYQTTSITVQSEVEIKAHNVGYGEYEIDLSRTFSNSVNSSDINSEENLQIELKSFPNYMTSNIERKSDGSTILKMYVGEKKDSYTENELFDISSIFYINMTYKIIEDTSKGSGNGGSTLVSAKYKGITQGTTITKNENGVFYKNEVDNYTNTSLENVGLCLYFGDFDALVEINGSNKTQTTWQKEVENKTIDVNFNTDITYWDRREEANKEELTVYSYRNNGESSKFYYYTNNNEYKNAYFNNNELTVKQIVVTTLPSEVEKIQFYKKGETEPFFIATQESKTYVVPEGETIVDYYAVLDKAYCTSSSVYPKWTTTYTLNIEKLKETLSENEVKNIREIQKYQTAKFGLNDATDVETGYINIIIPSQSPKYSYFDLVLGENFETNVGDFGRKEKREILLNLNKEENENNIYIKNPKFFVKLPDCFDYEDINVEVQNSKTLMVSNKGCTDANEKAFYIDSETGMLVINCYGEYEGVNATPVIKITFTRKLKTGVITTSENVKAYMITENGNYIVETEKNALQLSKNGIVPDKVAVRSKDFAITQTKEVQIRSGLKEKINGNTRLIYPNLSNIEGVYFAGTINKPKIYKENSKVNYLTSISANGKTIENINAVVRLPIAGNKSIVGNKYDLIKSELGLTSITLTNLQDIQVTLKKSNKTQVLGSSEYTLLYSTDLEATFDSNFTQYIEGDINLSNAKTIQILYNGQLTGNDYLEIEFKMEMPNTDGVAGSLTAMRYTEVNTQKQIELEPAAVYVKTGNPNGTIELQKKFQDHSVGTAPSGVSLEGIKFKFINRDTKEVLVIENQTDENGIVSTDATGKIKLTNVPLGIYEVEEISEFEQFNKIPYTTVTIENGETISKTVENPKKIATLIIKKQWEHSGSIQQGAVTFSINKSNSITANIVDQPTTNKTTGTVSLQLPYGTYYIFEKTQLPGWKSNLTTSNNKIELNQETVEKIVENNIAKGTLEIIKTVPEGSTDTVEGLKFNITGQPLIESYLDANGDEQTLSFEKTIVVGQEQEGVTFNLSEDKKSVSIKIENVYYGSYMVSEFDIPTIKLENGQEIERYIKVAAPVTIQSTGITKLNIDNQWKTGTISIKKTAEEGVELNKFKFRVYGTSAYGTKVDQIIEIDENGNGNAKVLVGKYTVEEIGTNAFTAHYEITENGNTQTTTIPQQYEVTNGVTQINVYNETSYGYVKIVKTLEGINDPSAAEGIQFQLSGIAPSGKNVKEIITIGKDGTGISNAIPAGGEYELIELENTLNEYYNVMDPMIVQITKENTKDEPLVLNIENKRGTGNLEISTETIPEGGPLYPIVYKVNEINLNEQTGKYTKIEGTEKIVNGDLLGKAKLLGLPSGIYLVEQESIPVDWIKDIPQIVSVPVDQTGIAVFTIEQKIELQDTTLIINKQILNPEGNTATSEDFEKYKLNENESFEVQIKDINTNEVYYTFIDSKNAGIIKGLKPGTYTIEEVYKPKYLPVDYKIINNKIETKIENIDGKYTFTIGTQTDGINVVELKIVNKMNTDFGFGGQDKKDNFSKYTTELVENIAKTRASLYIVDEEGNYLPDCSFEIYDSEGRKVSFFNVKEKRVIIKGLPEGVYTLKNVKVPNGYALSENINFRVYNNAVRVVRIEIQKNIARGNLNLETIYETENKIQRNVANSKYKIVNKNTNELITFIKKPDGTYAKSNLPTAVDTISIKAGEMVITGLETGTYQVGLVDVTDGFGLVHSSDIVINENITDEDKVPVIEIIENKEQDLDIKVEKKKILDVESSEYTHFILDSDNNLWAWGRNSYGEAGNGTTGEIKDLINISEMYNLKFTKISESYYGVGAIDVNGDIWLWGYHGYVSTDANGTYIYTPTKFNRNNIKFVDIAVSGYGMLALDENGKIWYAGYKYYSGGGIEFINNPEIDTSSFICISDLENNPLNNIKIDRIFTDRNNKFLIDSYGRLWELYNASNNYYPVCISETKGNIFNELYNNGIKIKDLKANPTYRLVLDENGNIYQWSNSDYNNAKCLTTSEDLAIYNVKIESIQAESYALAAIDESGKLWTWGTYNGSGQLGHTGNNYSTPTCINDITDSPVQNVKFEKVILGYYESIFIDNTNTLWSTSNSLHKLDTSVPNYEEKFVYNNKIEKVIAYEYATMIIDEEGRLWSCGQNSNYLLGNSMSYSSNINQFKKVEFPNNEKIKDVVINWNNVYAIDYKGKVWNWGISNQSKICISEQADNPLAIAYSKGIKIEKIYQGSSGAIIAIDNKDKIWMWGNNVSTITGLSLDATTPTCVSDIADSEFNKLYNNGVIIEKAVITVNNKCLLLDNNGKLWQVSTTINKLEDDETSNLGKEIKNNNIKIVDIQTSSSYIYALDSLGRVWLDDVCITEDETNILNSEYKNNNPIVSISGTNDYDDRVLAIDSNGYMWKFDRYSSPQKIEIDNVFTNASISYYTNFAIDKNKELWSWGEDSYSNQYGQLGNGTYNNNTTPENICEETINLIYNNKIINVLGNLFIAEDGYKYSIGNVATKYEPDITYLKNKGINIVKSISDGKIVLDSEGKIWRIQNNEYICETDIEGNNLNVAYKNGSRITIILESGIAYGSTAACYAIDNNGKMWALGMSSNALGVGEKDSYKQFVETEFTENVEIKEIVHADSNIVIVKDNNADYWIAGRNSYGVIGNGTTEDAKTFQKITLGDGSTKIKELLYARYDNIYIKDTNDVVWSWGLNNVYQTGKTSDKFVTKPYCWDIAVNDIKICHASYTDVTYNITSVIYVIALDKDGVVWTTGFNYDYMTPTGRGKSSPVGLGKVNNWDKMGVVTKISTSRGSVFAINENGELWAWGTNAYGNLGYATGITQVYSSSSSSDKRGYYVFDSVYSPVCLTKTIGNVFYGKQIKNIIDISTEEEYYGAGKVLVQDIENNTYHVGNDKKTLMNKNYMYRYSDTEYPEPTETDINYSIKDIKTYELNYSYIGYIAEKENGGWELYNENSEPVNLEEIKQICGITENTTIDELEQILSKGYAVYDNKVYKFEYDYNDVKYEITETIEIPITNYKHVKVTDLNIYVITNDGQLYGNGDARYLGLNLNSSANISEFKNISAVRVLSKPSLKKGWSIIKKVY